ncbi:MAG: TIGR02391 family protein [Sphingomonadales bacterium]|jgi:uncharacterized protein (TIGR02391 family)
MERFFDQFNGDADNILSLEVEELSLAILLFLKSLGPGPFIVNTLINAAQNHPQFRAAISFLHEAWYWLEINCLLVPDVNNGNAGYRVLGRKAEAINDDPTFFEFKAAKLLPKGALHERIRDRIWGNFVRAHFDDAVSFGFKQLEIYVREASGFGNDMHGLSLMRAAFKVAKNGNDAGPLVDLSLEPAEQEAQSNLFAGAYGYFRNPNAHRDVQIDKPEEALETILLTNHLFRIVDSAQQRIAAGAN